MNYTLHQLQVFLKIMETESITKAAEALHLSQPAVSIQLRNLQDQFDIPLTETIGRRLYITDFGREIGMAIKNIVQEVYAINYKTLAYKGLLSGRIRLSVVSTGMYIMPQFVSGFVKSHREVELVMDVTNREQVLRSLTTNETDFGLLSILPGQLPLDYEVLLPNELHLVARSDYDQQFQPDTIRPLLEQVPVIYREKGSGTRMVMEQFIESQQLDIRKRMSLTGNEAVKQAVLAGMGVSVMPAIGLQHELQSGRLVILPTAGLPMVTNWYLVWPKGKQLSPAATAMLEHIRQEKDSISRLLGTTAIESN